MSGTIASVCQCRLRYGTVQTLTGTATNVNDYWLVDFFFDCRLHCFIYLVQLHFVIYLLYDTLFKLRFFCTVTVDIHVYIIIFYM